MWIGRWPHRRIVAYNGWRHGVIAGEVGRLWFRPGDYLAVDKQRGCSPGAQTELALAGWERALIGGAENERCGAVQGESVIRVFSWDARKPECAFRVAVGWLLVRQLEFGA